MNSILRKLFERFCASTSPWNDNAPVREELFSIERLEQHAESLAAAQPVTTRPPPVLSLHARLNDNAAVLLAAYRESAAILESGQAVVPAAEWLLDNYHIVEEQIREIRDDLPVGFYKQLPKLADGPFAGYPRVFGLAWAFTAHTDSHFDPHMLQRFITAYQRVQPLEIGELWAVAITLRIVLIENLRRLADQMTAGRAARAKADALADQLLTPGSVYSALYNEAISHTDERLPEAFAAQLAKRLRGQDPKTMPALGWLEERLSHQDVAIDDVVQVEQQRQGASNLTVRNVITSMRLISDIDWTKLFESVSLVDARLGAASNFAAMDFPTRNLYRNAIEQLARGSSSSELEIAELALKASRYEAAASSYATEAMRIGDPGYFLISKGRHALERTIRFRPPARLRISRIIVAFGIGGYVSAILIVTALLLGFAVRMLAIPGEDTAWLALFAAVAFFPVTRAATAFIDRAVTSGFGAMSLPGLELKAGVPQSMRTIIAVPILLTDEAELLEQIERLEVHYLAGSSGDLVFALLADGLDADQEVLEGDERMLAIANDAIGELNERHGAAPGGDRFLFLYRRRIYNPSEGKWMGWERKRGKLHELNRLLRGATDTTFMPIDGHSPRVPADVRYVITLDADTKLPRDAALKLIGKMGHPLNRPKFDAMKQRVVDGYAILQPRVTPSLSLHGEGSLYQRIFSSGGGMDPYAAAISDVYQDLFGEGSFTGKGIYEVDAFEMALANRIPDNTMLSHDLFEGIFARAGLASDIEVVEEFPARYDVAAKQEDRWTRGDWQLLRWILGRRNERSAPPVGRGKMLDNLRRSFLPPLTLLTFTVCWLLPLSSAVMGTLFVILTIAIPSFLPIFFSILPSHPSNRVRNHLRMLGADLRLAAIQSLLSISFLADRAWRMSNAIIRTVFRLLITRRHLLEWTTAAQAAGSPRLSLGGFYQRMTGGILFACFVTIGTLAYAPENWPVILPFFALWLSAPAIAMWTSKPSTAARQQSLSETDKRELRLIARRTWRFFETFVTSADNMLPPDNFQEDPKPVIAHRTSPTNIGLYLLSAVAAREFGWAGTTETVERLEETLATIQKLPRFKGHLFNWYETKTLEALDPAYVSSVDSGNLAGNLIVLAKTCEEWHDEFSSPEIRLGLTDTLDLAREAVCDLPPANSEQGRILSVLLDQIEDQLKSGQSLETLFLKLNSLADSAVEAVVQTPSPASDIPLANVIFWLKAFQNAVVQHQRDRHQTADTQHILNDRLGVIADTARTMAMEMDFAFLLDPARQLLSIGYSVADQSLDSSCYDLLASEARLASLFAIAKGDVPTRHWFRLGRATKPVESGAALISWSGSMFEYLMPSLVMRAPVGSLLEQTSRLVVERQQSYAQSLGIPWGISESAYNARDLEFTYQYSNFGVPGLGLKRGLAENVVVAPYATGLATMVDPQAARKNYAHLASMGARGRYGFYEALDFTRSRLPDGKNFAIVRNFMAHHQGMTIVAITNCLHEGQMRSRFHREPIIQASELLLQERMTRSIVVAPPQAEAVKVSATQTSGKALTERRFTTSASGAPIIHLLSNGHYSVMLTTAGAGYSRWRDIAITRWKEDTTRDNWGSFIFLRDTQSGDIWSAALQPTGSPAGRTEVIFDEDRAEFIRHDGSLTTSTDVLVSGEDDSEVRRVSLANSGRHTREIDLTSYAELVLATPAVDNAHPAFAKMSVVTEYLAEFGALIATRRLRSQDEPQIWVAHFAVVEGDITSDSQYESDRAKFFGAGHTFDTATALTSDKPLSNTVGTVLDPVFSIRERVSIPPGHVARVAFWTVVAASRAELLDLIDKHQDRSAFDRAKTLAWTQAQVQLRYLSIDAEEAADFQQLAAPILYSDARFRSSSDAILRGAGAQSGLWSLTISGDLPIVLLRIDDVEDIAQVRQLLRAHEYWRMKHLDVDLVIVNERSSSYLQELQIAIETAVRSSPSRSRTGEGQQKGTVHTLRADLMSAEARALLQSVARVVLVARHGPLVEQLARTPQSPARSAAIRYRMPSTQMPRLPWPEPAPESLEFFNGLGGFDKDGREYVTILDGDATTPAPWINVIANAEFGFQNSALGSCYTWAQNSRENQLTPWSNDPVTDPTGEAIYIRDEDTGDLWTPTAQPIRDGGTYIARHGFGYSSFAHEANGIALELLQYVPLADPIKISRLTLQNKTGKPRRITITTYAEWVIGTSRNASGPFITTEMDKLTGAMLARNPWSTSFAGRVAFADLGGRQTAWTADRTEFLGHNGGPASPAALAGDTLLSGATGAGLDPCAALQCTLEIGAGETIEIVSFLGQCATAKEAQTLIARYREIDLDAVLTEVKEHWTSMLQAVQVKTPDRAMDIMLNGWLLYQTIACRIQARSAFYQASGAYGFRDQLQDGMALTFAEPEETRRHLLRTAARQFVEGDFQHWWLPHSGQGVRTRISDDRVWLAFAAATYVDSSGDTAILDETVPYLEGALLRPEEHDAFFQPMVADKTASLFEHCAQGIDQCFELIGAHGLPLMGTGDWNDGMNRVGEGGKGESVWLGWFLLRTVEMFAPLAEGRDDGRAQRWRASAKVLRDAIEKNAWDGEWYRRATYDDGTWLGSKESQECKIDSIAQSWSVLSGVADPQRAVLAMASVEKHLIRQDEGIARLFWPPFDKTTRDPGYIIAYPPGLRENGGQYTHAAMWAIIAFAKLGAGDKAANLFSLLNPINHARTAQDVERYKVEPYVVAADIYSVTPHIGRGGWTWYTGSAGWMYHAGIEAILGIRREGKFLVIAPCIPDAWPGFEATVKIGSTRYDITVGARPEGSATTRVILDGVDVSHPDGPARVALDGKAHTLIIGST
ncbi:MAG: GH36-type glycosyl hydrolase domain-containing protein [Parvibaculaceae bacterium]